MKRRISLERNWILFRPYQAEAAAYCLLPSAYFLMTEIEGVEHLNELVGREVALSEWVEVSQGRIDAFAEATGDRQWIHTDPSRAALESPFGGAVAHGFLTLSLLSEMMRTALKVGGVRMGVNCGLDRVRFISPVPAGSRVRGSFRLAKLVDGEGWSQATWSVRVECEASGGLCCVANWLVRYYV